MVFSSNIFLFFYLPVTLLLYYLSPRKIRNGVLFFMNFLFYGWGEPVFLILMLFVIGVNYLTGCFLEKAGQDEKRRRKILVFNVIVNLSLLGFFKYAAFLVEMIRGVFPTLPMVTPNIPLPVGISFYIFQTMSYVVDVYRRDTEAQKSFVDFGTYVALFPQLIAGPIVRYRDVAEQLRDRHRESLAQFSLGIKWFVLGLGKKILLANQMGLLMNLLLADHGILSAWTALLAYSFQIYFDFSGYSDMAKGLGKMLGFTFMDNFDYPYIAKSITAFWRSWHISLSSWFREYVYIPLGGNRKGLLRQLGNILIVWILTGLWHGASWNFVLWGLYYAILLMAEKLFLLRVLTQIPLLFQHGYTLFCILIGWGLFYFVDTSQLISFLSRLFHGDGAISVSTLYIILAYLPLLVVAAFASTPFPKKAASFFREKLGGMAELSTLCYIAVVLALCVAALASQSYNPFIYFRF